jgi:hypothetical protein
VSPDDWGRLATMFADDMNLEPDSYKNSPLSPFVDKLLGFSQLQLFALQDLIEEYCNVGMHDMTCEDFLKSKKLLLA